MTSEEIVGAIDQLDGIIGWLTKYGWYRMRFSHAVALRKTLEEGKYVAREEILRFASRAERRYTDILKSLKEGAGWEEIKQKTPVSDPQLGAMLRRLIDSGFVEKQGRLYMVADPLLERAVS